MVAWELSDSLELPFVLSCRESALAHAVPEIINSDQGSHFTSERFTRRFLEAGVKISMDGRGRYMDNIFTERLWRSVKYEEIYLSEYGTPKEAREGLGRYFTFYNEVRPHQALGYARQLRSMRCPQKRDRKFLKTGPSTVLTSGTTIDVFGVFRLVRNRMYSQITHILISILS